MKSLSKKLIISGIIFSICALMLCLGIFLQPQAKTVNASATEATLKGIDVAGDDGYYDSDNGCWYYYGWTGYTDGDVYDETYNREDSSERLVTPITSLKITTIGDPRIDNQEEIYSFDVTEHDSSKIVNNSSGLIYCYVFQDSETEKYDAVIYGEGVTKIYAPKDPAYLFSSRITIDEINFDFSEDARSIAESFLESADEKEITDNHAEGWWD